MYDPWWKNDMFMYMKRLTKLLVYISFNVVYHHTLSSKRETIFHRNKVIRTHLDIYVL